MKVLLLYKDYFPVIGGIENHLRLLAQGLRAAAVDARVLVTNTGPDTVRETVDGVPVTRAGRQTELLSMPISLPFLPALRRQTAEVDLVHLHAPYPFAEMGNLLLGSGKAYVITYHSDIVRQKAAGALYSPLLRLILRRAAGIAVSSPAYVESSAFLRRVRDKCRLIHLGIDFDRFADTEPVRKAALKLRNSLPDRPLLLFIGRMRHYKGVDILVRAMHNVDAHLLIVGAGPSLAALQELTRAEGLAARITFLGECSDRQSLAARYASDLFVLPSINRAEAFGIVQLEAMACGLPVISTELGTGTSYVNRQGETGLVVPPAAPDALASAISGLLADPARRARMGAAGRQRVRREFSSEAMIQNTIAFYGDSLRRQGFGR